MLRKKKSKVIKFGNINNKFKKNQFWVHNLYTHEQLPFVSLFTWKGCEPINKYK